MCPSTACFASMGHYYNNKYMEKQPDGKGNGPGAVAFIVGLNMGYGHAYEVEDGDEEAEAAQTDSEDVRYLDWVLNRSPWSSAFCSKDAEWCFKKRSVIMEMDVPSNLMVGGGVAVRRLWETVRIKQHWLDLTKAGVQEDLAYFLAASIQRSASLLNWEGAEVGHMNLAAHYMTKEDLLAFLKHKPFHLNNSYAVDQSYQNYSKMFVKDHNLRGTANEWISACFPFKDEVADKPANVLANPFAKAVVREERAGNWIDYDKGVQRWAEFQHKLFKEIGYE